MNINLKFGVAVPRPLVSKKWRSERSKDGSAERPVVVKMPTEEVLIRDTRGGVRPSEMVERKLILALKATPRMVSQMGKAVCQILRPEIAQQ